MSRLGNGRPFARAPAVVLACGLLLGGGTACTDRLRIDNVKVARRDAATATVKFDIAWWNPWRHGDFHDAAWVFFKVRADEKSDWQHVRLAADKVLNPTGYGQEKGGTPLDFVVPDGEDGFLGMFVRRAEYGVGKVAATNVTAVWDLTANKGIEDIKKVRIQAFGIEMVFVPEGPFYLGSGGTERNHFYTYTDGTQHTLPYRVTGHGAIPTGRQDGRLWARKGAQPEDGGEIPASFPNGYAAFYCMKYHISQAQYAGFLNTLTAEQAQARYAEKSGITPAGKAPNYTYTPEHPNRNCQSQSWADAAAFGAWAALRPMTELEFEKISRGPMEPGWDTGDELDHPSYWGVEGWCGWRVLTEHPVTVANATGRRFRGTHGRGTPTLPADWPRHDAVGAGIRCSPFALTRISAADISRQATRDDLLDMPRARLSDRFYAAFVCPDRHPRFRWRGVRSAPKGVGP